MRNVEAKDEVSSENQTSFSQRLASRTWIVVIHTSRIR